MEVIYERCSGLDVHTKTVVACLITRGRKEIHTFSTMTDELLQLRDWLSSAGCPTWRSRARGCAGSRCSTCSRVSSLSFWVQRVPHLKTVLGRKTDVCDCEWLADLSWHGLLKASCIPPREIRELRELLRYRQTLVTEHMAEAMQ